MKLESRRKKRTMKDLKRVPKIRQRAAMTDYDALNYDLKTIQTKGIENEQI